MDVDHGRGQAKGTAGNLKKKEQCSTNPILDIPLQLFTPLKFGAGVKLLFILINFIDRCTMEYSCLFRLIPAAFWC